MKQLYLYLKKKSSITYCKFYYNGNLTDKGFHNCLRIFGKMIYASLIDKQQGWIRILWISVAWKQKNLPLLFSQRNGFTKMHTVGNYFWYFI